MGGWGRVEGGCVVKTPNNGDMRYIKRLGTLFIGRMKCYEKGTYHTYNI